jgi:hypothetical protein
MKTKSLDTPTIDETLTNLTTAIATQDMTADELAIAQSEAKQALLQWHKSKARSYVPEEMPTKNTFEPIGFTKDYSKGYYHCITDTLKAIEESK